MIAEYVRACGENVDLGLSDCCARYGIEGKKDITLEYLEKGIGFEDMPQEVVEEYGRHDVWITSQLFLKQLEYFKLPPEEIASWNLR